MKDTVDRTLQSTSPSRLDTLAGDDFVFGDHPTIRRIGKHAERASEVGCTVLISGETGTGKEIWAKLIHRIGPRAQRPFVPVNCAALSPSLAESQLFGHEKGAFTGAFGAAWGVFRAAAGGVVFLDEVGEMPWELQPKLLRVLQEHEVTPVGAATPINVDVQVIAATNRELEEEVHAGRFREDLYFRLNMVELQVPALCQCVQDIPAFVEFFSTRFAAQYKRPCWKPDAESIRAFCEYSWPGNIRQLSHVIERSYVLDCAPTLPDYSTSNASSDALPFLNLNRLRAAAVKQALRTTRGHKGRAARLLGVHANTLTRMLGEQNEDK